MCWLDVARILCELIRREGIADSHELSNNTGVFNKYIAFLNKNSYFSINHQTSEDGSLAQNGAN
jgi:hypothetical protein